MKGLENRPVYRVLGVHDEKEDKSENWKVDTSDIQVFVT